MPGQVDDLLMDGTSVSLNAITTKRLICSVYRNLLEWLNAPFEDPPQLEDAAKALHSLGITP